MATDFFQQQDAARHQTSRLIAMTVVAVVFIVVAVYGAATGILLLESGSGHPGSTPIFDGGRFALVATAVLLVIASGSLYKTAVLSQGGEGIALMLGGRPVDPNTSDPSERKLLNVVEEMAIASGIPVPPVYLLDREPGINAFAAGFSPTDAVIGVNQGTIQHLTRDQLQGVIGHEFSHILNGDMRLNLRLMGLVHGILVISLIGQLIFRFTPNVRVRSSSDNNRDSDNGAFVILIAGTALMIIGSVGVLVARIIKCAISRQREYLADASAVQFTRNPLGLADALKKIGGLAKESKIESPNAEQACHMFFGQGVFSFHQLLATHPPLQDRILRLDPSFQGAFEEVAPDEIAENDDERSALASGLAAREIVPKAQPSGETFSARTAIDSIGKPSPGHVDYAKDLLKNIPAVIDSALREPFSSRAVIYALLLDADVEIRKQQLVHLNETSLPGTVGLILNLLPTLSEMGETARVPLVDLAFPALRMLTRTQYRQFRSEVEDLVKADNRVSLFEYTLKRMLIRNLDQAYSPHAPVEVEFRSFEPVLGDAVVLVGALARIGHDTDEWVQKAFQDGVADLAGDASRWTAPPPEACSLVAIDRALDRLARSLPAIKKKVIDGCGKAIASDGRVTLGEGELLRAIADSLDCPMPPLLGS